MIEVADAALKQENCIPMRAPAMPKQGIHGGYIREPYRVLCYWVPDWSIGPDAGRWKLRIDTLVQPPAPEYARTMVHPVCPRCNSWAIFTETAQDKSVTHLLPVACECGWEGVSLRSVRQTPENGASA